MKETEQQYNVIHIISDQHNYRCIGGNEDLLVHTPNLDALSAEGVSFNNAYTANPICTPSRISQLSGQYCHNHGYFGLSGPIPQNHLPTYLGNFKRSGYRTAAIGKIHVPDDPLNWLVHQNDVDVFKDCYFSVNGIPYKNTPYFNYLKGRGKYSLEDSHTFPEISASGCNHDDARISHLPYEDSVEAWCIREAVDFIVGCEESPFCMQVSLPRPHACYTPAKRFWDMYPEDIPIPEQFSVRNTLRPPHFQHMVQKNSDNKGVFEPKSFMEMTKRRWRGYLASITQVDYAIGELIEFLKEKNLMEQTIVIYTSDHGAYTGNYGIPEKAPGICSEEVCRIPFIWKGPGIQRNLKQNQLVESVDLVPTLFTLCGIDSSQCTDGTDLSRLLSGSLDSVKDVAVTENPWSKAIRFENWRFVHYQPDMFGDDDIGELYNLAEDPNEKNNLYYDPEYIHVVHVARRKLLEWLIKTKRNRTTWPAVSRNSDRTNNYVNAKDGTEANGFGPELRLKQNQRNYL